MILLLSLLLLTKNVTNEQIKTRFKTNDQPGECTFDRWCGYEQDAEDDFDWLLGQSQTEAQLGDYDRAQYARLHSPFIHSKNTHCVEFEYKLTGAGQLSVYIVETSHNELFQNPVWSSQNSNQAWSTVQLALNPTKYKIVFQATVTQPQSGHKVAIKSVSINYVTCSQSPHFLRLGNLEVNEGESAELQCLANGASVWASQIKLQTWEGTERGQADQLVDMGNYQSARFNWKAIQRSHQDKVRCIASNATSAGISNYAQLIVKTQPIPIRAPEVETAGATFLLVRLNIKKTNSIFDKSTYTGDGPLTGMDFYYRKVNGEWEDKHSIILDNYNGTYKIWHLEPDTLYEIALRLSRPGQGGTGELGPLLQVRTRCNIPSELDNITADPIKGTGPVSSSYSDSLAIRWRRPSEKEAGCRTWSYTVKWRELGGIWKLKELDKDVNNCVLPNLKSYTSYDVIVAVRNVIGTTETRIDPVRTMDGFPEQIPAYQISTYSTESDISLTWTEPPIKNGVVVEYRLVWAFHSSFLPPKSNKNQSGQVRLDKYEYNHKIQNLIPGAVYNITLSARTAAGYGRPTQIQERTKIGRPVFGQVEMPIEIRNRKSLLVRLQKAKSNGAPVSRYNVIVEPNARRSRRAPSSTCFKREISYNEFIANNDEYYYAAQFEPFELENQVYNFEVGDGRNYSNYYNPPLDQNQDYTIWFQALSIEPNCVKSCDLAANCHVVAASEISDLEVVTELPSPDFTPSTKDTIVATGNTESALLYGGVATVLLLVLFIFVGAIVCIRRRAMLNTPETYHVSTAETGVEKSDPSKFYPNPYNETKPLMPDLVDYPSSSRRSEAEDFAVRVEDFPIHVSQMRCSRTYGFSDEFETLPEGATASWDVAQRAENIQKNRYNNILPYDHARVILRSNSQIVSKGDYINASWISGYGVRYIAAQGPTDQTCSDFWHCVYQENTRLIIMVTGLVEVGRRKCHQYWPDVGKSELYGSIMVKVDKEQTQAHYTVRDITIQVHGSDEVRKIKQMQYHSWPDHGVPNKSTSLLQFVRRSAQLNEDNQPIVVHCSAGSGRSGCFIVLDWMLRMADHEGLLDIYNTVKELRQRRVNMVANLEQYIFLHDALLEAVLCGETGVKAQELARHYDNLITVSNGNAPIQEEFETLTVLTPRLTTEECQTGRLARNRPKNRFMDVLPADRDLPYLITPDPAGSDPSNNYINAVFGDSFLTRRDLVITQMPLPHTVGDFWRLIHDYSVSVVVMLNDASESDESTAQYWPEEGESKTFGAFTIDCEQKDDEIELVSRTLKLTNYYRPSDPVRRVKQVQLTNWPAHQPVPSSRNSVLRLSSLIDQFRANDGDTPTRVLVHCVAGAGRSGTFAACLCVIQQLKSIQTADVFSSVLQLRAVRPQLVETLDQYRFIYEVAMEYADSCQM